jgi:hypothetical protein
MEKPREKWPTLLVIAVVAFVLAVAVVTVAWVLLINSHPFGWD